LGRVACGGVDLHACEFGIVEAHFAVAHEEEALDATVPIGRRDGEASLCKDEVGFRDAGTAQDAEFLLLAKPHAERRDSGRTASEFLEVGRDLGLRRGVLCAHERGEGEC